MGNLPKSDIFLLNMLFGELLCWPEEYVRLQEPIHRSEFLSERGFSARCIDAINALDASAFVSCTQLAAVIHSGLTRA